MKFLACSTVAVFGIEGLLSAQLILDTTAVTPPFVTDFEVRVILVHLVRRAKLPVVEAHFDSCRAEESDLYRTATRIRTQ